MIELLLEFILCFTFGFGMGALVLEYISSKHEKKLKLEKKELISQIENLNGDIRYLKERFSVYRYYFAADAREFKIIENFDSFDVVLKLVVIPPYREESVLIKRFYFKNDFEYAKLCA